MMIPHVRTQKRLMIGSEKEQQAVAERIQSIEDAKTTGLCLCFSLLLMP